MILEKDRIPDRKVELDLPIMTKFVIERAEVADPNADEAKLQWVDITPQTMEFFLSNRKQLDFAVPETVVASLLGPITMPTDGKSSSPTVGLLRN